MTSGPATAPPARDGAAAGPPVASRAGGVLVAAASVSAMPVTL